MNRFSTSSTVGVTVKVIDCNTNITVNVYTERELAYSINFKHVYTIFQMQYYYVHVIQNMFLQY